MIFIIGIELKRKQIIELQRNKKEALNYLVAKFWTFKEPNKKFLFDIANFYKNAKEYKKSIEYYSMVLKKLTIALKLKQIFFIDEERAMNELALRKADEDFFNSLKIKPKDAYVLNYLAYSWLERNYKINEAIEMLETAYASKSNDPYIIDLLDGHII